MLIPISAAQVNKALNSGAATAPPPRIVKAAHEFEAQLMKELLKPLTAGDAEDGADAGGSTSALGEFGSESLGAALSARGGFGIADRLIAQLSRSGHGSETVPARRESGTIGSHEGFQVTKVMSRAADQQIKVVPVRDFGAGSRLPLDP